MKNSIFTTASEDGIDCYFTDNATNNNYTSLNQKKFTGNWMSNTFNSTIIDNSKIFNSFSFTGKDFVVGFEVDKYSYPETFIFEDLIAMFSFHNLKISLKNRNNNSRFTIREQ